MTQVYHQVKFRWTENLTRRFIQLRKENGKMFTGRKYSAQAGWDFILRQMQEEFPTIMSEVHYRVLKKKWSNLLQQYKELKNPVHGDKNKADDVSWAFYGALDELFGNSARRESNDEDENNDNVVKSRDFPCVSLTPEVPASPFEDEPRFPSDEEIERNDNPSVIALRGLQPLNEDCSIKIEGSPRRSSRSGRIINTRKCSPNANTLISRLPRATELSIKMEETSSPSISVKDFSKLQAGEIVRNMENGNSSPMSNRDELEIDIDDDYVLRETKRLRRTSRNDDELVHRTETNLERRIEEFINYTKRRDEENRNIMLAILQAVEKIADKLSD